MLRSFNFSLFLMMVFASIARANTADFCTQFFYERNGSGRVFAFFTDSDKPRVDVHDAFFWHGDLIEISTSPRESYPILAIESQQGATIFRAEEFSAKIYGLGARHSGTVFYQKDSFQVWQTYHVGEPPESYPCPR